MFVKHLEHLRIWGALRCDRELQTQLLQQYSKLCPVPAKGTDTWRHRGHLYSSGAWWFAVTYKLRGLMCFVDLSKWLH